MSSPEEVLSYWFPEGFSEADPQTHQRQAERWMAGGLEVDSEITERFGETLEQARRGELDHWAQTARGRLALIVVLEQFSRNVYRGSPLSYAQDEKALRLAVEGIEFGMDRELSTAERFFFWLLLGLRKLGVWSRTQAALHAVHTDLVSVGELCEECW